MSKHKIPRKVFAAFILGWLFLLLMFAVLVCGCSALQPSTKSQSLTVTSIGLPAVVVVSTTSQQETNTDSDDTMDADQAITNDIKPNTDLSLTNP